jgi:hypothetical protein
MIERHEDRRVSFATVSADRSVLLEEPSPCLGVRHAPGRVRCQLNGAVRGAAFRSLLSTSRSTPPAGTRALLVIGVERVAVMLVPAVPAVAGSRRVRRDLVTTDSAMLVLVRRTARWGAGVLWPVVAIGRIVELSRQNLIRLK